MKILNTKHPADMNEDMREGNWNNTVELFSSSCYRQNYVDISIWAASEVISFAWKESKTLARFEWKLDCVLK